MKSLFSLFSMFLSGGLILVGSSIYNNLSFAEINLGESTESNEYPKRISLSLPKFNFKVEYNNDSVEEKKAVIPVKPQKKKIKPKGKKSTYYRPKVVENKEIVGMVNGEESVLHYGFKSPDTTGLKSFSLNNYFEDLRLEETLSTLNQTYSSDAPPSHSTYKKIKEDKTKLIVSSQKAQKKDIQKTKDLILYDYSNQTSSEKKIQQLPQKKVPKVSIQKPLEISTKGKVSNRVLDAIGRELEEKPSKKLPSFLKAQAGDLGSMSVRVYTAILEKEMGNQVFNFEFIPDYDKTEVLSSDEEGIMDIQTSSLKKGILRGRIVSLGHMRTVVNLPLGTMDRDIEIPLMDEETFNQHLDNLSEVQNSDLYGGFVLTKIGKDVVDADIDKEYFSRIFLDEEFQEISREDDYSYILFLGVESGNGVLSYLLRNGRTARKIVHVPLDEILFDLGDVERSRYKNFELYKRNVFSVEKQEFGVQLDKINYFNQDLSLTSKGLNRYEFQGPPLLLGGRDYLRFDHLEGPLYVGFRENHKLELPDKDFIENILFGFGLDELDNACLVQFNFPRCPRRFKNDT